MEMTGRLKRREVSWEKVRIQGKGKERGREKGGGRGRGEEGTMISPYSAVKINLQNCPHNGGQPRNVIETQQFC